MRLIFVSGKYMDKTQELIAKRVLESKCVADACWERGWAVICPAMNTLGCERMDMSKWERFGISEAMSSDNGDVIYSAYLEILSRCDAIIMVDNWVDSRGSRAEHKWARMNAIPVFYEREGIPHPSEVKERF